MELQSNVIREARIQKGWTQQQLSEVAGLSLRTIQRVESAGQGSLETCNALCAVLDISRDDVLQPERSDPLNPKGLIFPIVMMATVIGFVLGVMVTLAVR
ncbi:helix-turn-helix transcriptional regulator [Aliidiomarina sanyensis]|uniref:XRE family transcriptional regulator n=1 Tax=Aliidiomarina sanyensis TaxID=1249555 RepID=A0A432WBQ0_9GAMM|nr:helix-turn-helix transcriptional regulator [Aliidiomarina sanyensis]RUO29511.1 XRE family transcriptional regulator [Aliidiomarina sanyensis]